MPSKMEDYVSGLSADKQAELESAIGGLEGQEQEANELTTFQKEQEPTIEEIGDVGNNAGISDGKETEGPEVVPDTPGANEPQPNAPQPTLDPDQEAKVDNPKEPKQEEQISKKDSMADYPPASEKPQKEEPQPDMNKDNNRER